jgi:hypothetical protein
MRIPCTHIRFGVSLPLVIVDYIHSRSTFPGSEKNNIVFSGIMVMKHQNTRYYNKKKEYVTKDLAVSGKPRVCRKALHVF